MSSTKSFVKCASSDTSTNGVIYAIGHKTPGSKTALVFRIVSGPVTTSWTGADYNGGNIKTYSNLPPGVYVIESSDLTNNSGNYVCQHTEILEVCVESSSAVCCWGLHLECELLGSPG